MRPTTHGPSLLKLGAAVPLWAALGLLMLVLSLALASTYFYPDPPRYAWQMLLIVQALLVACGSMAGQQGLGELTRLLQSRVTPLRPLRAAQRLLHRRALQFWLLSVAPLLILGAAELSVREFGGWSDALAWFTAAPALLSLLMLACLAVTAAWQGRASVALGAGAVLLLAFVISIGWGMLTAAWIEAGWPIHLTVMLLLWPASRLLLSTPARARSVDRTPSRSWQAIVQAWRRYWCFIDPRTRGGLAVYMWLLPQQLLIWGQQQGGYPIRLSMLVLFTGMLLQSRDLHWRQLLAPGGTRRRWLGLRIFAQSLQGSLVVLLAITAVAALPALFGLALLPDGAWGLRMIEHLPWATLNLVCDLALATAIAATLRGFTGSHGISAAITLLAMLLVVAGTSSLGNWRPPFPELLSTLTPPDGWPRIIVTLGLGIALLPLLQRAWLKADLAQLARRAYGDAQD